MARRKKGGGFLRAVGRLLVLAVAAGGVLAAGMYLYDWKPFGLTWQKVTGHPARALRPVVRAAEDKAKDAQHEVRRGVNGVVDALRDAGEEVGEALEDATESGKDAAGSAADRVRQEVEKIQKKPAPPAGDLDDADRKAKEDLLKQKGL